MIVGTAGSLTAACARASPLPEICGDAYRDNCRRIHYLTMHSTGHSVAFVAPPDAQVLKGILSMLLLQLLTQQADYGYAIVVRLRGVGLDELAEGTVYPALTRLESKGYLESWLEPSTSGPARKYYRPTNAGRRELTRASHAWGELEAIVDRVMTSSTDTSAPIATEVHQ